ncbi:MAG: hypothetical protein [Microvirus sp.]|nr:MAG: hypothetical protein [Microvirus sp.]
MEVYRGQVSEKDRLLRSAVLKLDKARADVAKWERTYAYYLSLPDAPPAVKPKS